MNSRRKYVSLYTYMIIASISSCGDGESKHPVFPETIGLAAADFILSLQNADGRIMDSPDSDVVNVDSNMEYACIGLAAAYAYSGEQKYLGGLANAVEWLADREEMDDMTWKGSWYYAYGVDAPYDPFPLSPGAGIDDVRGVDATSALFVYILYLYTTLSKDPSLAVLYENNARAALDFLLTNNYDSDRYFYSSWQKSSGVWNRWDYRYAADQADVYLGLQAGYLLYNVPAYGSAANEIATNAAADFFSNAAGRFVTGMANDGSLDAGFEEFNTIFPQGYLTWVFGPSAQTEAAYAWLESKKKSDGGIYCYSADPGYSLTVAVFALAARSLGQSAPLSSFEWIALETFDEDDGGICDSKSGGREKFSNVAGFMAAATLGFDRR